MNMFEELNKIMGVGNDTTIVIRKLAEDKMTVSVNFRNNAVKDEAKDLLQPFIVSGTPAELDGGFVAEISKPIAESAGLQTSMQEFEAAKKVAKAKSAALADQKKKEKEEEKARKEQYAKYLDAAKKAQAERKWKEAISALTSAKEFADEADKAKCDEGIAYCKEQDVPDLFSGDGFGEEETEAAPAQEQPAEEAPAEQEEAPEEQEQNDDLPEA